jgi:oligosaccharide repeat unit polymerase
MSTQTIYPLRLPGIQVPAPANSSLARRLLLVLGLTTTLVPVLLALFDLRAYQAVPIAVLLGLAGQRLAELALSRHQDLFEPVNLVAAYFILYFAFRAIYVLGWAGVPRLGFFFYDDYLPAALWCASLGYVAFTAGYYSNIAKRILARLPESRLAWPRTAPGVRIGLLLIAGFAAWLYLFRHDAFVVGAVGEEAGRRFHEDPMPGIAVVLGSLLDCGWVAVCIAVMRKQRKTNQVTIWAVAGLAIVLLTVRLAYTGGKQYLLEPLLQAGLVYHYLRRRLRLRHAVLLGIPCAFLAFGALNAYRFVIIGESGGAPTSFTDLLSRVSYAFDYFTSDRTDGLQKSALESLMQRQFGVDALALVMKYTPDRRPFGFGESYLTIPEQTFVPRQVWKDKPIYIPTDDFERDYLGVPPGGFTSMHVISDLYQNFNIVGVVVGLFGIGIVFQLLYLACAPGTRNGIRILAYAVLMPGLVHALEAEPVVNSVVFIRLAILLFLVVKLLGTRAAQDENKGLALSRC